MVAIRRLRYYFRRYVCRYFTLLDDDNACLRDERAATICHYADYSPIHYATPRAHDITRQMLMLRAAMLPYMMPRAMIAVITPLAPLRRFH